MTRNGRRTFLKQAMAGLTAGALPLPLRQALARPVHGKTGTVMDVEHVVILMQENRSFDHYFGMLRGVRASRSPAAHAAVGRIGLASAFAGSPPVTPFRSTARTARRRAWQPRP